MIWLQAATKSLEGLALEMISICHLRIEWFFNFFRYESRLYSPEETTKNIPTVQLDRWITSKSYQRSENVSQSVVSHSWDPLDCSPPGSCPWNSPGKNTGVGCHALLQEIFPAYGSNLGLLHCRQILYHLSYQGSPNKFVEIVKIVTSWNEHLTFSRERTYQVLWIHSVPVLQMHYFHFPNISSSHQPQGLCTCCYI